MSFLERHELIPLPKAKPRRRVDQACINQAFLHEEECKIQVENAKTLNDGKMLKDKERLLSCASHDVRILKRVQEGAARFGVEDNLWRTMKEWQALDTDYHILSLDGFRDIEVDDYKMGLLEYIDRRTVCTVIPKKKYGSPRHEMSV